MDTQALLDLLTLIINTFSNIYDFFSKTIDMGVLGEHSLLSLMFGAGLTLYLLYQFATWLGNLIT